MLPNLWELSSSIGWSPDCSNTSLVTETHNSRLNKLVANTKAKSRSFKQETCHFLGPLLAPIQEEVLAVPDMKPSARCQVVSYSPSLSCWLSLASSFCRSSRSVYSLRSFRRSRCWSGFRRGRCCVSRLSCFTCWRGSWGGRSRGRWCRC